MIYKLLGKIVEKQPSYIVLDVNGVGYEINISLNTFSTTGNLGDSEELYTYMSVRDDAIILYGFSTLMEKELFKQLITVSGIGSKLAIKILGGIGVESLKHAISSSDHLLLSTIPGVGKKSAERIVVELKDKFDNITFESSSIGTRDIREDVIGALINLGYKVQDCRKAIEGLSSNDDFEVLLKSALKVLTGKG